MTASLPMYDAASTREANDRFWQSIRSRLGYGPAALDRASDPHATWQDHDLALSQTCGLPYRTHLHDRVALVGTPDYGLRGCPPGYYRSAIVVRKEDTREFADFADGRLARNDVRSQSGWAAWAEHWAATLPSRPYRGKIIDTGSHRASAQAVAAGKADIAALDGVTWTLLKRETDLGHRLQVMAWTRPTPGLPFITAKSRDANALFDAIAEALTEMPRRDRRSLLIKGIIRIPKQAYLAVPNPAIRQNGSKCCTMP